MGTTETNIPIVDVPRDDGSITRAIEELDAGISSWVEAIRSAQCAIAQAVATGAVSESAVADVATAVQSAAEMVADEAVPASATTPVAEADASVGESPTAPPAKTGLRIGHLKDKPPAPAPIRKGIRVYEETANEAPVKDPRELTDEDESLLAELNPKLARQVRIRRRLCNGTKSIRELIAEVNG